MAKIRAIPSNKNKIKKLENVRRSFVLGNRKLLLGQMVRKLLRRRSRKQKNTLIVMNTVMFTHR